MNNFLVIIEKKNYAIPIFIAVFPFPKKVVELPVSLPNC